MKLYSLDHSPYATRVRMQIRKKELDIAIEPPPVALRTPEFVLRFPLGKIPVLELDDGSQVPDSWVIMEYLEDVSDAVLLRPRDAQPRAHMNLLARYTDTCLGPAALFPLFARVGVPGGTEGAQEQLAALEEELARLERLLRFSPDFRQRQLHLGDLALAPSIDYVLMLAPLFGLESPLQDYPLATAWWDWASADDAVSASLAEMRAAVQAFFGG